MSAWTTFRFAVWRELWGRWPLHGVVLLLGATGLLLPSDWGFPRFVACTSLIVLVAVIAAGGRSAADPFWRGLGGPGWARIAGAVVVQMPPLFGALAAYGLRDGTFLCLVLFATVVAARTLGGGPRLILAPLGSMAMLGCALLVSSRLFRGDVADIYLYRGWCVGTSAFALFCAARWENAREGARRGRRAWGFVAPIALVFVGSCGATAAASLLQPALYPAWGQALSGSGEVLLVPIGTVFTLGRAQVWRDGERRDVGPRGAWSGSVGPHGSVVLDGDIWKGGAYLVAEDGETRRCEERVGWVGDYTWRDDGRAVILNTHKVLYRFDFTGCERIESSAGAWLGDALVSAEGIVVRVGGRESFDAPGPVDDIVQSEGHVYVLAAGILHELTHQGLEPIAPVTGASLQAVPHGVCSDEPSRCWSNGTRHAVDHPTFFSVDVDVAWDHDKGQVYVPSTGRALAQLRHPPMGTTYLADGTLRMLDGARLVDISPTGVLTERVF